MNKKGQIAILTFEEILLPKNLLCLSRIIGTSRGRKINMTHFIFSLMMIFSVLSCTEAIEKPKNILEEEKMSEIIADFAINEQSNIIGNNINSENATRFILKKYKIKGELFTKSYEYYMTKPETMKEILAEAQNIIKAKDPKAEAFINKKLKENPGIPPQAR